MKKRVVDNFKERRRLGAIDSRAIEEKCSVGRNIFIFFLIFVVFLEVDCIVCCAFFLTRQKDTITRVFVFEVDLGTKNDLEGIIV